MFIVTPIVGVCNCSMFCCALLYVHYGIAIISMGKRELIALLNLSSWCRVMVGRLFLAVPWGCLQFVIVIFPDHAHLLFIMNCSMVQIQSVGGFSGREFIFTKCPVTAGKKEYVLSHPVSECKKSSTILFQPTDVAPQV